MVICFFAGPSKYAGFAHRAPRADGELSPGDLETVLR